MRARPEFYLARSGRQGQTWHVAAPLGVLVVPVVVLLFGCDVDATKDRANPPPKIAFEGIGSGELVG